MACMSSVLRSIRGYSNPAWCSFGASSAGWSASLPEGAAEHLAEGRSAIERALELNPDLPLAHNLYTNIQVDR